jgi:hypothetical protein
VVGSGGQSLTLLATLGQLYGLDPQILRQHRLVLPDLVNHRLGCITLEEELDDLLGLALTTP